MSEPHNDAGPLGHLVDKLGAEFVAAWDGNSRPKAEGYLARIVPMGRAALLRELLTRELEFRARAGEEPEIKPYLRRFPQQESVVLAVFEEHRRALAEVRDHGTVVEEQSSSQAQSVAGGGQETLSFAPSDHVVAGPPPAIAAAPVPSLDKRAPLQALTIGQYEVLGHIAAGGMGVVYKARQIRLNRVVALKMIRDGAYAGAEDLARFQLEAQAVARLQHPHIVQVYEIGESDGRPFIAMEYMGGGNLARKLAEKPLLPAEAAVLVETLAGAMHAAHQERIVHRDLKPANIMLAADGTPKISDFGLAKELGSDQGQTNTGAVLGTPSYMAPEQAAGASAAAGRAVGPAADVYALGAILYEALVGRPPFKGATILETLDQVRTQEPVPPRHLQPRVPVDLDTICLKRLQKEPAQRYASAQALADDLRRFQSGEPISARPIGAVGRLVEWARRRPAIAALVLVSFLAFSTLLGGGVWSYVLISEGALREKDRADEAIKQTRIAEEKTELAGNRLVQFRHAVYNARLGEVGVLSTTQPSLAHDQLEDTEACPFDLRDWTWRLLHHQTQRRVFSSHELPIVLPQVLALSADGTTLASCTQRGLLQLWDVKSRGLVATLGQNERDAVHMRFAPDGKKLALVDKHGRVQLWDVVARKRDRMLRDDAVGLHGAFPTWQPPLAFSSDGKLLAMAGVTKKNKHQAWVWNVGSGVLETTLEGHAGPITSLDFSPDGQSLLSGSVDRTARYWNLRTKAAPGVLEGHARAVRDVAVHPSGQYLASASEDGTVRIWSKDTLKLHRVTHPDVGPVHGLAFSTDAISLAAIGLSRQIRVMDAFRDRELLTLAVPRPVGTVAFLPGKRLAYITWNQVEIHDIMPWRARSARGAGLTGTYAVSADRQVVAAAFANGQIHLRNVVTLAELRNLPGHKAPISAMAFLPGGQLLATSAVRGSDGIKVWNTAAGTLEYTLPGQANRLAVAPDGKTMASIDAPGSAVVLWDLEFRQEKLSFATGTEGDRTALLAYAPDGKTLATASNQGRLYLRDPNTGRQRHLLEGHSSMAMALAFSPDGARLASAGLDETVKIWDVATGRELATMQGHQQSVLDLAWTPDGRTVISVGIDETVRFWDVRRARETASLRPKNGLIRQVAVVSTPTTAPLKKEGPESSSLALGGQGGVGDALVLGGPGYLQFWDVPHVPVQRLPLKMGVREIHDFALARKEKTLAITGTLTYQLDKKASIGFVDLWQLDTGQKRTRLVADFPSLHAVAFSPDDKTLAVGGQSPNLWLIDIASGKIAAPWPLPLETITCLEFSHDGKWLACGGKGTKLLLIDTAARQVAQTIEVDKRVGRLAFAPDGKSLLFVDATLLLRIWDLETGQERPQAAANAAGDKKARPRFTFEFSLAPDGRKIASVRHKEVSFLDLSTFALEQRTLKSDEPLQFDSIAYSPGGDRFVTGGLHGNLEVWRLSDSKRLAHLPGGNLPMSKVLFTADGKQIIASPMSGPNVSVLIWTLP